MATGLKDIHSSTSVVSPPWMCLNFSANLGISPSLFLFFFFMNKTRYFPRIDIFFLFYNPPVHYTVILFLSAWTRTLIPATLKVVYSSAQPRMFTPFIVPLYGRGDRVILLTTFFSWPSDSERSTGAFFSLIPSRVFLKGSSLSALCMWADEKTCIQTTLDAMQR